MSERHIRTIERRRAPGRFVSPSGEQGGGICIALTPDEFDNCVRLQESTKRVLRHNRRRALQKEAAATTGSVGSSDSLRASMDVAKRIVGRLPATFDDMSKSIADCAAKFQVFNRFGFQHGGPVMPQAVLDDRLNGVEYVVPRIDRDDGRRPAPRGRRIVSPARDARRPQGICRQR